MDFTPKVYETEAERRRDFIIGFIGWFILNIIFSACVGVISAFVNGAIGSVTDPVTYDTITTFFGLFITCLPLLLNVGGIIYFGFTRSWIALGALAAFAALLVLSIILTICFLAACFVAVASYGY